MAMTLEVKLASAMYAGFLISGTVEVEFEYTVHEEITEVDGPTCRIERDLYVDYVYNVVPVDLVIEHPSWDEDTRITHPDSTDDYQPDYNLWSTVLNNLPDEWWNDEIVYNNNLWEYIDD